MAKKKEFDLIENPEAAVEAGLNKVETFVQKHKEKIIVSESVCYQRSGLSRPEMEPRLFSVNRRHGACPLCDVLGKELKLETDLVVTDKNMSLASGASSAWPNKISGLYMQTIKSLAKYYKFSVDKPFNKLTNEIQEIILLERVITK